MVMSTSAGQSHQVVILQPGVRLQTAGRKAGDPSGPGSSWSNSHPDLAIRSWSLAGLLLDVQRGRPCYRSLERRLIRRQRTVRAGVGETLISTGPVPGRYLVT